MPMVRERQDMGIPEKSSPPEKNGGRSTGKVERTDAETRKSTAHALRTGPINPAEVREIQLETMVTMAAKRLLQQEFTYLGKRASASVVEGYTNHEGKWQQTFERDDPNGPYRDGMFYAPRSGIIMGHPTFGIVVQPENGRYPLLRIRSVIVIVNGKENELPIGKFLKEAGMFSSAVQIAEKFDRQFPKDVGIAFREPDPKIQVKALKTPDVSGCVGSWKREKVG